MKTKITIKNKRDDVLFEYEKENNTIKDTVEEAVRNGVSLENADLVCADLSNAYLSGANLCEADLSGANIREANLSDAYLKDAHFEHAYFYYADLSCANLSGANLREACLFGVNFRSANLSGAYLSNAIINAAGMAFTNLSEADLSGVNLYGVDLTDAKNIPYIPMNIPDGELIGWKKLPNGLIVKLKILADSKRSRATSDKCRCDKALVLEFQNIDGSKSDITEYTSRQYAKCKYKVGEIVYSDSWDETRWNECSHGIHFFLDRQTAVDY